MSEPFGGGAPTTPVERRKYGAQQMEAFSKHMTNFDRIILFSGIFLVACAYTLCNILDSVYEVLHPLLP
jgi:hypothetical protein